MKVFYLRVLNRYKLCLMLMYGLLLLAGPKALYAAVLEVQLQVLPGGNVALTWNSEPFSAAHYQVYRQLATAPERLLNQTILPVVVYEGQSLGRYVDHGAVQRQENRYRVVVLDSANQELARSQITPLWVHDGKVPARVQGVQAKGEAQSIAVSWSKLDDVEVSHYWLYRKGYTLPLDQEKLSKKQDYGQRLQRLKAGITQFVDNQVQAHRLYYYRLVAVDPYSGEGPMSLPGVTALLDVEPPLPVATLTLSANKQGQVNLRWPVSLSDDVTVYRIMRSHNADVFNSTVRVVVAMDATTMTATDHIAVDSPFTWFYRVLAVDGSGNVSAASPTPSIRLPDAIAPRPPVLMRIAPVPDAPHLFWNPSRDDDVTHYDVYRIAVEKGVEPQKLAEVDAAQHDYQDHSDLSAGLYRYFLTAVDASGNESRSSRYLTHRVLASTVLPVPTGLRAHRDAEGAVVLQWLAAPLNTVAGYLVYRSVHKDQVPVQYSALLNEAHYRDATQDVRGNEVWYQVYAYSRQGVVSDPSERVYLAGDKP